jgi:uncharacterized protein YjiS (DUF1127 family)
MYAFRQESCTGCTGPGRQMCEVRPASRTLFSSADEARLRRPWLTGFRAAFVSFCQRAAERRRQRQITLELSRLDDRTLRDIGISRPEIEAAIARAKRGRR